MRPPPTWLADGLGSVPSGPGLGDAAPRFLPAVSPQQVEEAGRLLDEDDARQWDLAQQLRIETGPQYAQQPAGVRAPPVGGTATPVRLPDDGRPPASDSLFPLQWPPLLSVVQHRQLPSVVEERVLTRQVFSLCGLFPEIHRAWATVDNALFLWRYDAQCVPTRPAGWGEGRGGTSWRALTTTFSAYAPLRRASPSSALLCSDEAPLEFTVPDVALVSVALCTPRTGECAHLCFCCARADWVACLHRGVLQ